MRAAGAVRTTPRAENTPRTRPATAERVDSLARTIASLRAGDSSNAPEAAASAVARRESAAEIGSQLGSIEPAERDALSACALDDVDTVREMLLATRAQRGAYAERAQQQVGEMAERALGVMRGEAEAREQMEAHVARRLEKMGADARLALRALSTERERAESALSGRLGARLGSKLIEERESRVAMERRARKHIGTLLADARAEIEAERVAREQSLELVLRMMEEAVSELRGALAGARRQRERSDEVMVRLLEEACAKTLAAGASRDGDS